MKMYIMRHAEAIHNAQGVLSDNPNEPIGLTTEGIRQATLLAERLKDTDFTKIYVSELTRTQQTADLINTFHDAPVVVEPLLNENRTGFNGKPVRKWMDFLDSTIDGWHDKYGDGESRADVFERCRKFYRTLAKTNEDVAVVTHGFLVEALRTISRDDMPEDIRGFNVEQGKFYVCEL